MVKAYCHYLSGVQVQNKQLQELEDLLGGPFMLKCAHIKFKGSFA